MPQSVGLFFGSFNPVHVGHLIIAEYMAQHTDLDQVWLVLSPQNPLKAKQSLANDYERLHLLQLAVDDNPDLRVSQVEFGLPKPSYTVDTLAYLREKYPALRFVLIMGGDNLQTLHKWKNHELLLREHPIYVYRRPGHDAGPFGSHPSVRFFDAPLMDISASFVRRCVAEGRSIRYLVPEAVRQAILQSGMYRG